MPTDLEQLARLALAAVLGGLVGAERELADQPAGLRTHVLLAVGTCLFTLVSAYGFGQGADPSRLAAQIVTGIGFLGDRKSTRLNSSHGSNSYAVFCLKKKKKTEQRLFAYEEKHNIKRNIR